MDGVIKTLKEGYGFIKGDDNKEYFFHISGLVGTPFSELGVGLRVKFEIVKSAKGPRAESVVLVE